MAERNLKSKNKKYYKDKKIKISTSVVTYNFGKSLDYDYDDDDNDKKKKWICEDELDENGDQILEEDGTVR